MPNLKLFISYLALHSHLQGPDIDVKVETLHKCSKFLGSFQVPSKPSNPSSLVSLLGHELGCSRWRCRWMCFLHEFSFGKCLQYSYEHFYGRASLGQVVNIVDDRMIGTPGPSGNLATQGNSNTRTTGVGPVGPGVQVALLHQSLVVATSFSFSW